MMSGQKRLTQSQTDHRPFDSIITRISEEWSVLIIVTNTNYILPRLSYYNTITTILKEDKFIRCIYLFSGRLRPFFLLYEQF